MDIGRAKCDIPDYVPPPQNLPRERPSWIAEKRKKIRRRVAGGYLRVFSTSRSFPSW